MRLTVLGSSGSVSGPDNPASGYLLESAGAPAAREPGRGAIEPAPEGPTRIVLDFGPGTLARLQRHCNPATVNVALSHLHPDHCLDVPSLLVWRRFHPERNARWRSLLLAPEGAPGVLGRAGATDEPGGVDNLADQFAFRPWGDRAPVRVGSLRLVGFPAVHPVPAFSVRVEEPETGQSLCYSGDTGPTPDLVEAARGVDVFFCEANWGPAEAGPAPRMHLTAAEAGRAAKEAGARRLVVVHVPPWVSVEETLDAAAAEFPGPVSFGHPGATFEP